MRFLSADYLFTLTSEPLKNGVLQVNNTGEIINIFNTRSGSFSDKIEIYSGILCPGFINSHCHLELSHLKGISNNVKGFSEFLSIINQRDDFSKSKILDAIKNAEEEMLQNGIVAIGDVCNTTDTLIQKKTRNLLYYNFIETFEVSDVEADNVIEKSLNIRDMFRSNDMKATITPHALYSVPPYLMSRILKISDDKDILFSIHNQETNNENKLFLNKEGDLCDWLKSIKASPEIWHKRDASHSFFKEFKTKKDILLVHNTYTSKQEITDNYYCTCPKANLFIEQKIPDYSIFNIDRLCVGTDSLASNDSLSIMSELSIIQKNSDFTLQELLKIACKNGAKALGFKDLGTFEIGKKPGVNLISNFALGLEKSDLKKII